MDPDENDDLAGLAARARDGDLAAYGRLVERTEGDVRAVVSRLVRDIHLAEDALQETYLRAFRRLPGLRDPGAVVGWLRRVARTTALNGIRARRRTFVEPVDVEELPASPTDTEETDALRRHLARALVALSPEDRRLCERRHPAFLMEACGPSHNAMSNHRIRTPPSLERADVEFAARDLRSGAKLIEESTPEASSTREAKLMGEEIRSKPCGSMRIAGYHGGWTSARLAADAGVSPAAVRKRLERIRDRLRREIEKADMLLVGEDVGEWDMMPRITRWVERLLGGARLRLEQVDYPMMCGRAWMVAVEWNGAWTEIAGQVPPSGNAVTHRGRRCARDARREEGATPCGL